MGKGIKSVDLSGGGKFVSGNNNWVECRSSEIGNVELRILGNDNRLLIEEGVVFKEGMIWIEDSGNEIVIGAGTTLEGVHLAVAEKGTHIRIGRDCMFSSNIRIATTDSHSIIDLERGERINPARSIDIGDHVWIGTQVGINKGVCIGNGAIVGSHAVVTRDVSQNTLVAGVPAKTIKRNVSWIRKRI